MEYIAFGEVLFEEHNSSFSSPYLFNGKELDRETNLSYYWARYLDMKTSLWLSVDPLALYNPVFEDEFYFDGQHNRGIYNSGNLSNYNYCYQNPVLYIDPNGKQRVASTLLGTFKIGIDALIINMSYPQCGGDCKSWMKSNYIGPSTSPLSAKEQRKTGVEPVDEVDLAAYNHDVAYDKIKAAGVKGAVIDLETLPADEKLLADSWKVLQKVADGKKDAITGDEISLMTGARARQVIRAFEPLVKEKKTRIAVEKKAKQATEIAKKAAKKAKEILVEPVIWRE